MHPRCLVCIQAVSLMCIQAVCRRSAGVLAGGCNIFPAGLATLFMKVRSPPRLTRHAVHAVACICRVSRLGQVGAHNMRATRIGCIAWLSAQPCTRLPQPCTCSVVLAGTPCGLLHGTVHSFFCGHLWGWFLARGLPWTSMVGAGAYMSPRVWSSTRESVTRRPGSRSFGGLCRLWRFPSKPPLLTRHAVHAVACICRVSRLGQVGAHNMRATRIGCRARLSAQPCTRMPQPCTCSVVLAGAPCGLLHDIVRS